MKAQNRQELLNKIINTIGDKKLYWFGTRGTDAQPLFDIPQFDGVFSQVAKMNSITLKHDICLEDISGTRVNLDAYDLDYDTSEAAKEFIDQIDTCLRDDDCFLMGYRPQNIIDTMCFGRQQEVTRLMLPTVFQKAFDFKPWVEQSLKKEGIPIIEWEYSNEKKWKADLRLQRNFKTSVIRRMYSSGGSGVFLLKDIDKIDGIAIDNSPQVVAISKYLEPSYSVSVNAVVFPSGKITLHSPSIQILGKKECTDYDFGFCGNDFGAMSSVSERVKKECNEISEKTGKWLHLHGYLGAFGIDILVYEDKCYLAEINPRFLGSSQVGAQIDVDNDRSDIYLNHLAAFMNIEIEDEANLMTLIAQQEGYKHVIYHNINNKPTDIIFDKLVPNEELKLDKGCIVGQSIFN